MKKSIIISLHLLYWVPKFTWLFLTLIGVFALNKQDDRSVQVFLIMVSDSVPALICFYVFYLYLFPVFLAKKRVFLFIIYGLAIWIILSLIAIVILKNSNYLPINNNPAIYFLIQRISPGILSAGIAGCLFKGFISWYSEKRIKEQLIQKNLRSELALLKAQINPHFLFNTLNNIDILIERDAKAASIYLKQLSEIMRFMLFDVSSDLIPLSKELEYIKKYIELQKIRTLNGRYVNFKVIGESEKQVIAPAIFIPFIENAFKHTTNKKIEDAIIIRIEITENKISFTCLNYFDNSNSFPQEKSGLGIDLIKQRLQLLYKDKHELNINKTDNQFEVNLNIITE
jgi:two-component system LytT family sensor kinase